MNLQNENQVVPTAGGCGSSSCQCAAPVGAVAQSFVLPVVPPTAQQEQVVAAINGISLHEPGQQPDLNELRETAYTELLRQRAVTKGLLPLHVGLTAPELDEAERIVIEAMVDDEVLSPQPHDDECQRYYDAHQQQFLVGQALHVRHILFAVTPGVNVQALTVHAERALLELSHKSASVARFAQLAQELSNCPSSAQGGDLGWITPEDCAPELANELFHQKHSQFATGVHPQLMHSRFGFHIMDVLDRRVGRLPAFGEVHERIKALLQVQSRAKALHQYMTLLVGDAQVVGLELEGADSPLVQ
jgi:peptidyl-prolyl cis-trans isomerase C